MRTNGWSAGLAADYSAVAARGITVTGASGRSGAQGANATVGVVVPLNEQWFVPVSVGSRNLFLGGVSGAPIPDEIHTAGANVGLGYRINDQWTVMGSAGPRFYRVDSLDSTDIGVGGMVRASYQYSPRLAFAFGLAVEPDRDIPVLPMAGVRWRIQTNLTVSLMFPRSGINWRVDPRLNLFAGLSGNFTVFRLSHDFGDQLGQTRFNSGLGTYRDFRVGVGLEYRLVRGLGAEVEGGYSFRRDIDYTRIDETVKFGSAPFVQAGLRLRF